MRLDRKQIAARNERIRADYLGGRDLDIIVATYGVTRRSINRIIEDLPLPEPGGELDVEPLAEWELALREGGFLGSRLVATVPVPSLEWIDSLEDVEAVAPDRPCVYFVQEHGAGGHVKIGASSTLYVRGRVSGMQGGNPRTLVIRRLVLGDVATEARLHAYFADLSIRGEWFTIDDELARVSRGVLPG